MVVVGGSIPLAPTISFFLMRTNKDAFGRMSGAQKADPCLS